MCQAAEVSQDDKQVLPVGGRNCFFEKKVWIVLGTLLPKTQLSGCKIHVSTQVIVVQLDRKGKASNMYYGHTAPVLKTNIWLKDVQCTEYCHHRFLEQDTETPSQAWE